jgi:serine/threonine-protein kinase
MRPAEGTTLAGGRYTFVRHLGSGGMASVWLARDETLHREVAIKLMADTLADDDRWLARFKREARAAAALSHEHIVKVFDFGIEDHRPYLVMAHISGGSLRDRIRDGGELPDAERLARELLSALAHVHAAGIVHRDVKPGNILLDEHDRSQLTDFGIARPQDGETMTQTGMVMGTIRYLAPEVAEGGPATERSDLYAAGGVLREIAGEDPPPRLARVLDALTAEDPGERPPSADDALARLDEQDTTRVLAPLRGDPQQERPEPRERAGAAVRQVDEVIRRPWFLPAAGIAAVVLLAAIVIALAGGGGGGAPGPAASPAPASAPLDEQLRGLDRAIDAAASR